MKTRSTREAFARVSSRVLLFGEAVVDELPGGPVVGGAPLNVAVHLAGFGLDVLLVSRIGEDPAGELVRSRLADRSLRLSGIQRDPRRATARVLVTVVEGQPSFEIPPEAAFDAIDARTAEETAREFAPALVYFGTLAQRRMRSRTALRRVLDATSGLRFLDLNLRAPWIEVRSLSNALRQADLVKLNAAELEVLSPGAGDVCDAGTGPAVLELLSRYRIGSAFVTCGERGALHVKRGAPGAERTGAEVCALGDSLVDTVGAGDAFAAVAILGTLRGWPPALTIVRADSFARALCQVPGAVPEDPAFHARFLASWGGAT
ncbi:MAG: carbohydrate kinase [Acidobacteria bacterium]|nr:carbohydrate kinase [Acidobacteriota bacterium]